MCASCIKQISIFASLPNGSFSGPIAHFSGVVTYDSLMHFLKHNSGRIIKIKFEDSSGGEGFFFKDQDDHVTDGKGNMVHLIELPDGSIASPL